MKSLGEAIAGASRNNLNTIRLFLALAVIGSHSFPLSLGLGGESKGEPLVAWTQEQESLGSLAVDLFFLISGMLITASWLRAKSMQEYLMRRVLRIYPGFIVAVGFSGILIWLLCPEFRSGMGRRVWIEMLVKDWVFLSSDSLAWKGIFAHNPFPGAANGSLWTIPKEFLCYLLVAVIGLFTLFRRRWLILLAAVAVWASYAKALYLQQDVSFLDQRFLVFFLAGMSTWLWRDRIPFSGAFALGCVAALVLGCWWKPLFSILLPVAGGYLVWWLGFGLKPRFLAWTEKTDLSYGVYLYAFPVQQVIAMNEPLRVPLLNFLMAAPITLGLAWCSWHWVEKRFLALKKLRLVDFDPAEAALKVPPG